MKNKPLNICNLTIHPGERLSLALPNPDLYTCAPTHIPIHVVHGKMEGPCLVVSAGMHGDQANGIAIIQKLLKIKNINSIYGTLIAIPVVNVYGLITKSRNLPDGRDLPQCFPGLKSGTYAARLAHFLTENILSLADVRIDLHTGEPFQSKLAQIRTHSSREDCMKLAEVFGAPVILPTDSKEGLFWDIDHENSPPTILYEVGEALRLDDFGVRVGVKGITKVMRHLNMMKPIQKQKKSFIPMVCKDHYLIRSPGSGLCTLHQKVGKYVSKGTLLAKIDDPFGTTNSYEIFAEHDGMIILNNTRPIVNEGDSIFHIAKVKKEAAYQIGEWRENQNKDEV